MSFFPFSAGHFTQTAALSPAAGPPGGYVFNDADAEALVARMSVEPDDTRKALIDDLVVALKAGGVWSTLDCLYLFAAHDSQAALLNWKSTSFDATLIDSPTFTADQGFATDGVSSHINTSFSPAVAGGSFGQNSATFGLWSLTSGQTASVAGSWDGADGTTIACRTAGNVVNARINQATGTNYSANTDGTGFYAVNRTGATATQFYRNGAAHGTGSTTSIARANDWFRFGRQGGASTYVAFSFAAGFIGGSMSGAEHTAFYNAMNTYMAGL